MVNLKYGRPKRRHLDSKSILKFLRRIGFKVKRIDQPWRHFLAFGKFKGKAAVFKLASTQTTSPHTQNEYNWNEAIHLIQKDKQLNFTVPENFSRGFYDKLFYFICQRFSGEPLVKQDADDLGRVAPLIKQIAKVTREIETLVFPKDGVFIKAKNNKKGISVGGKLFLSAREWASQVPQNLDQFLKVIEKTKNRISSCPGHGDFVPRQMYMVNNKIGLIDGEHAGFKGPLYYDAAQFYLRLRCDYKARDLAKKYLKFFKSLLTDKKQGLFWEELKPVLIQRFIGEWWGAGKNIRKINELKLLGKEILQNNII